MVEWTIAPPPSLSSLLSLLFSLSSLFTCGVKCVLGYIGFIESRFLVNSRIHSHCFQIAEFSPTIMSARFCERNASSSTSECSERTRRRAPTDTAVLPHRSKQWAPEKYIASACRRAICRIYRTCWSQINSAIPPPCLLLSLRRMACTNFRSCIAKYFRGLYWPTPNIIQSEWPHGRGRPRKSTRAYWISKTMPIHYHNRWPA